MPCAVGEGGAAEFVIEAGAPGEEGQEPGREHGHGFEFYAAGGGSGVLERGDDGGKDGAFPRKGWVRVSCPEDGHCWMLVGFGEGDGCGIGVLGGGKRKEDTPGWRWRFRPIWGFVKPLRRSSSGDWSVPHETMTRFALMMTERMVLSSPLTPPLISRERQSPLTPTAVLLP